MEKKRKGKAIINFCQDKQAQAQRNSRLIHSLFDEKSRWQEQYTDTYHT